MWDSKSESDARKNQDDAGKDDQDSIRQVPYDEQRFFESFYSANVRGEPLDRMTIGVITDMESRFHYNVVENAIIEVLARRRPPPPQMMVEASRMIQRRAGHRLLDLGSGTGHWIDFFREVFLVAECVGVEITTSMSRHLEEKYADEPSVRIINHDIVDPGFDAELIGGAVDYISAIGVMFHVVDDDRWLKALQNLVPLLKPEGLVFVGGDFGATTRNVQFHQSDQFRTWREFSDRPVQGEVRVNKRVRSLADWHSAAGASGLRILDLVRTPRNPQLTTPENNLLVLGTAH